MLDMVIHSWVMNERSPLTNDQRQIKMERAVRPEKRNVVGMLNANEIWSTWWVVSRHEKLTMWENTKPEINRRRSFGDLEMRRLEWSVGEAGVC